MVLAYFNFQMGKQNAGAKKKIIKTALMPLYKNAPTELSVISLKYYLKAYTWNSLFNIVWTELFF